jgi:uncharacterized protein YeeX (DUF496 family)
MTQEELWRNLGTMQQIHYEFCEMVKKLRDAQKRMEMLTGEEDINFIDMIHIEAREAETEVDKYLANYFQT